MRLSPDARTHIALVVDDQATARQRMFSILADAGWRVSTAGSAAEALDKARTERPAIIFMDIVMPGMDGYQACRKLAVDPATRAIPVVFVSTKCQRADQVLGTHAGRQGADRQAVQRRAGSTANPEVRGPMTAARIGETGAGTPDATRFGARLAGVAVAMPAGTPLEFIVGAAVYPLPLAPARVAGLMQLRGQPLVALDASPTPACGQRAVLDATCWWWGKPPQAAALLVDGLPQALPREAGTWPTVRFPTSICNRVETRT